MGCGHGQRRILIARLLAGAVLVVSAFGFARVLHMRFGPAGLAVLAGAIALLLVWRWRTVALSGYPRLRRFGGGKASKWPVPLARHAADGFAFHPGHPEGYAGYTDRTAMNVDVNDDLAAREPDDQFAMLGFACGFLDGIEEKVAGAARPSGRIVFRFPAAERHDRELLGWLGYLQLSGTDNAGPSTANLHSVIRATSAQVCADGPLMMNFWFKVHEGKQESLQHSRTTPAMLDAWRAIHQAAREAGQQLARMAVPDQS